MFEKKKKKKNSNFKKKSFFFQIKKNNFCCRCQIFFFFNFQKNKLSVAVRLMHTNLWQVSFSIGLVYIWQYIGPCVEIDAR